MLPTPPKPVDDLLGRSALLDQIEERLASEVQETVVLYGLGGVGKTQLAAACWHRLRAAGVPVAWVRAGEAGTLADDYERLPEALGLRIQTAPAGAGDRADPARRAALRDGIRGALDREREWFIVFDGAPDPGTIARYVPAHGPGRVLITSRRAAWRRIAGAPIEVDVPDAKAAIGYLIAHAEPGTVEREDRRAAEAIAKELGCLPAALSQALGAMRALNLGLREYLDRFRADPGSMLATGTADGYDQPVTSVWSASVVSVQAQDRAAGALLHVLSLVGPGPVQIADLVHAWGAARLPAGRPKAPTHPVLEAVKALRHHSLVRQPRPDTISMHRLLQLVVRLGMSPDDRGRWLETTARLIAARFPATAPTEVLDRDEQELRGRMGAHAGALADHAEAHGTDLPLVADLLQRAASFYAWQGRPNAMRRTSARAAAMRRRLGGA